MSRFQGSLVLFLAAKSSNAKDVADFNAGSAHRVAFMGVDTDDNRNLGIVVDLENGTKEDGALEIDAAGKLGSIVMLDVQTKLADALLASNESPLEIDGVAIDIDNRNLVLDAGEMLASERNIGFASTGNVDTRYDTTVVLIGYPAGKRDVREAMFDGFVIGEDGTCTIEVNRMLYALNGQQLQKIFDGASLLKVVGTQVAIELTGGQRRARIINPDTGVVHAAILDVEAKMQRLLAVDETGSLTVVKEIPLEVPEDVVGAPIVGRYDQPGANSAMFVTRRPDADSDPVVVQVPLEQLRSFGREQGAGVQAK